MEEREEYSHRYYVSFTWRIANFSAISTVSHYSTVFCGGDHKWKILVLPKGHNNDNIFGLFLGVADSATLPDGWSRRVKYTLSVISELDEHTVSHDAEQTFNKERKCLGPLPCMYLDKLRRADLRFLVGDTCTVRAEVWFNEERDKEKQNKKRKLEPKPVTDKVLLNEENGKDEPKIDRKPVSLNEEDGKEEPKIDRKPTEQEHVVSDRIVSYLEELLIKKAYGQVDSISRDDLLLKQCMARLNSVRTSVNLHDYKGFVKTLVRSRDMRLAFMSIPEEMIVDFVKDL